MYLGALLQLVVEAASGRKHPEVAAVEVEYHLPSEMQVL